MSEKKKAEKASELDNLKIPGLPPEAEQKLKEMKDKIDSFKKKVLEKFDKYVMGMALLPPPRKPAYPPGAIPPQHPTMQGAQPPIQTPQQPPQEDFIDILVLVDDSDSTKMPKFELRNKLVTIIDGMAQDIDPKLRAQVMILSELWQNAYDAKYEINGLIAMSAPLFDKGMLAAIKIAEVHKTMVIKKFERYIVSYVLAGSLTQGKATETSDIDVWVVIDDTDVKKMTRAELKDKLRAIIIGMGIEAGDLTGVKNKLNIQVYILTDFWDSLKEANPVIFTLLRDGVPFYDRGLFMPWKQMLKMGKIKPSQEAIDLFMNSGTQMIQRVQYTLKALGMEDTFYAILTPSQAALMLYGVSPPTPRETPELMREIFVKKEKMLEEKYIKILENNIKVRKDLEHGTQKELSGKEVDQLVKDAQDYLERIKKLFEQIQKIKEEDDVVCLYDTVVTIIRDSLLLEGVEKVEDEAVVKYFEKELVHSGKVPSKFLRMLKDIMKAKKDYDEKKLSKVEVEKIKKSSREIIKFLIEYMQRKRGREFDRIKVRVKHGDRFGEVILFDTHAFIIHDIDNEDKTISRATVNEDGRFTEVKGSSLEEYEKELANAKMPKKTFIKEKTFEDLKKIFGKDVEILLNY